MNDDIPAAAYVIVVKSAMTIREARADLERSVEQWIADGYMPVGGVSIAQEYDKRVGETMPVLIQAVYRKDD